MIAAIESLQLLSLHWIRIAKDAKIFSAAVAATGVGHHSTKEGVEKIFDVVSRYRLHWTRKKLKDVLEKKNTIQEYTALVAQRFISPDDDYFPCENCNGEFVVASDKLSAPEAGDGCDNARWRHEKLKSMLQKMEFDRKDEQLKYLAYQLTRKKDLHVSEFGSLQEWEAHAHAVGCAGLDSGGSTDQDLLKD